MGARGGQEEERRDKDGNRAQDTQTRERKSIGNRAKGPRNKGSDLYKETKNRGGPGEAARG